MQYKSSRSIMKAAFWAAARYAGPLLATRLWLQLVRRHGLIRGHRHFLALPPGPMRWMDHELQSDQRHYLRQAECYGPIFRSNTRSILGFPVIGFDRARRLLAAGGENLVSRYKNLDALFPIGHLRSMHGATHRQFRPIFVRAMRSELVAHCEADLRQSIALVLAEAVAANNGCTLTMTAAVEPLRSISTRLLVRLFLGIPAESAAGVRIIGCYNRITAGITPALRYVGPNPAFALIQDRVAAEANSIRTGEADARTDSVLRRLVEDGALDPTVSGILAYMVETGRFDLFSLLRWVVYYLADQPQLVARIRAHGAAGTGPGISLARATVLETLRSNQSEAIQRRVLRDIEFEGHFFPAGSQIQFCLWEPHKDPAHFHCPFRFDPERFRESDHGMSEFAPFGLDQHRCVAADYVVALTTLFVEEICTRYELSTEQPGGAVRGQYHWEPDPAFSFRLLPVHTAAPATSP